MKHEAATRTHQFREF